MYQALNAESIIATAARLAQRVEERFPDRGLPVVAAELVTIAGLSRDEIERLDRPNWSMRLLVGVTVALGAFVFIEIGTVVEFSRVSTGAFDLVQGIEASINTLILAGLGLAFLLRVEGRTKRARALKSLSRLRSIAHVIDMHQLDKDPGILFSGMPKTKSSPKRTLSIAETERYLDYCSNMLSLIGKLAALYPQSVDDPVVINTANDIETLSTNLSRKIWQKIIILSDRMSRASGTSSRPIRGRVEHR